VFVPSMPDRNDLPARPCRSLPEAVPRPSRRARRSSLVTSLRPTTLLTVLLATLASAFAAGGAAGAGAKPMAKAAWLTGVEVTEYFPAPESWFVGKKVAAPGLAGKHRIDWLYSATGLSMEGDGIGLDGRQYHIDALGDGGWVTSTAHPSVAGSKGWKGGSPVWRAGAYYLTKSRELTFPLDGGGWSNGTGRKYVRLPGVSFASGPSRPLSYYRSIAVDPRLIPLGSRVYVDAYRSTAGGGWFTAADTGGAIIGRHIDVYRPPPATPDDGGQYLTSQRIYVVPPGKTIGRGGPSASSATPKLGAATPPQGAATTDPSGGAAAP
jgi:3D (Asp-Asp-Asp) domain-containing protein